MFASKHEITKAPNQHEKIVKTNKKGSVRQNTNLGKVKIFKPLETSFSSILRYVLSLLTQYKPFCLHRMFSSPKYTELFYKYFPPFRLTDDKMLNPLPIWIKTIVVLLPPGKN